MSSARVSSTPTAVHGKTRQEDDNFQRSKKKIRSWEEDNNEGIHDNESGSSQAKIEGTYKAKLMNLFGEIIPETIDRDSMKEMFPNVSKETGAKVIGSGIEIPLADEEWNQWSTPWMKTLITKVMGKSVNFKTIDNNLQRKWAKKGPIKVVDMADGYFLVYFSCEEDYNHALFEGPWRVADHYLLVQRWSKLFFQEAAMSSKVAVWLRIPKLPLELYNTEFLWRIGSSLGTMLKIDRLTSIHSRGKFARICVELDLDKPLFSHILIRGHKLFIEYEGLHQICFSCGCYGHKAEQCKEITEQKAPSTNNKTSIPASMEQTTASLEKTTITDKAATVQQVLPQLPASPSSSTSTEQIKEANNLIPKIMEDTIKKDLTEESFGPWNIVKRKSRKNLNNSAKFVQLNPKIKGGDFKLANHANMHDPTCMLPRDHRKDGNRSGESVMPSNNKGMGCVENVEQKSNNSSSDRTNKNTSATQPVNQRVRNTLGGKNPQRKQHKEGKNLERKYASPLKPSFIPKGKITPKPLVNATETIKVDRVDRQENFQILENIKIMERNIPKDFVFSSLPSDPMVDAMVETDAETLAFAEKLKNQRETNVKSPTPISHKKNGVGEMEIEEKNLHSGSMLETGTKSQFSPNNY
jgi:hypothetical protein